MIQQNTVNLGDCLDLMKNIPDGSVDMILCDLPYGTTQNKWDVIIPLDWHYPKPDGTYLDERNFLLHLWINGYTIRKAKDEWEKVKQPGLWHHYERIIKPNGAIVLTSAQPFSSTLVNSNRKWFKYSMVWDKKICTGFLNAKKQPLRQHEDILVFYKKQPVYNPQMHSNKLKKDFRGKLQKSPNSQNYGAQVQYISEVGPSVSYPRSIIHQTGVVNNSKEKLNHPTQKPVDLFEYLIKTYTNEGDIVLDNCAGSGTTGIACINTNRNYILMEKEEKYYDIINNRINSHIPKLTLF